MKKSFTIIFLLLLISGTVFGFRHWLTQVSADGTYVAIGTGAGNDGSQDAINFSQGRVWTIDTYGKYIWLTEKRSDGAHYWAWSNDTGTTWSQSSESYNFLTRGSVAYDSINDVLHVIWSADSASDGIIYRRYSITRDGSNNITSIQRVDTNVNLQLDTSATRILEEPVALWVNDGSTDGILAAVWTKRGGSLNEARGSMRALSMTDADGTAGNWTAIDGTGDTFSIDAPAVAADKIYSDTSGSSAVSATVRGGNGSRKDDLYVFVAEEDDSADDEVLAYRATWSAGSGNWNGGWSSSISMGAMGTASGYSLKYQLITKPVLDSTNDRLYIGWARYKDVTSGDTVSIAYLNSSDTASATVDVYSANDTHSYAPTLDIAYDATQDLVYVSYVQSTTNGDNGSIYYKTYNGSSLSSATIFYTTPGGSGGANGSADIPILYENRSTNDRLLFAFRVNGALPPTASEPHTVYWGYISLPDPSPASATTSTSSSQNRDVPTCGVQKPGRKTPQIYAVNATKADTVTLYFAAADPPVDGYTLQYGVEKGIYPYGVAKFGDQDTRTYTVHSLSPNTTYYFRIRATNGCASGDWSNELSGKTLTRQGLNPTATGASNLIISSDLTPIPQLDQSSPAVSEDAQKISSSGYSVTIKVADTEKKPVEGAKVILHSTRREVTTDKEGVAQFDDVEPGDHKVTIEYANQTGEQTINLTGDVKVFELAIEIRPKAAAKFMWYGFGIGILATLLICFGIWKLRHK